MRRLKAGGATNNVSYWTIPRRSPPKLMVDHRSLCSLSSCKGELDRGIPFVQYMCTCLVRFTQFYGFRTLLLNMQYP